MEPSRIPDFVFYARSSGELLAVPFLGDIDTGHIGPTAHSRLLCCLRKSFGRPWPARSPSSRPSGARGILGDGARFHVGWLGIRVR